MAPKTLSSFLSPFTLSIPTTELRHHPTTLILCGFSPPHPKPPLSEGTGAAAPTPGDRFLESRRSFDAAKLLLKEKKKKKRLKEKPLKLSTAVYWVGPLIGAAVAGLLYDNGIAV